MSHNKFRKKPVVIFAAQWHGNNVDEIMNLCTASIDSGTKVTFDLTVEPTALSIHTLESTDKPLTASIGDWIIVGVKGEVYPCKPDIFAATYEPAG